MSTRWKGRVREDAVSESMMVMEVFDRKRKQGGYEYRPGLEKGTDTPAAEFMVTALWIYLVLPHKFGGLTHMSTT